MSRVPALALTALARPEARERTLAAGYQGHLTKPVDIHVLLAVLASLVAANDSDAAAASESSVQPWRAPESAPT